MGLRGGMTGLQLLLASPANLVSCEARTGSRAGQSAGGVTSGSRSLGALTGKSMAAKVREGAAWSCADVSRRGQPEAAHSVLKPACVRRHELCF